MKLSIIGAGNVGATTAFVAALRSAEIGIREIVLVDILENIPQGKALDLNQCMAVFGSKTEIIGTNSYDKTAGSDIVVITAGLPRKPGMSRDDLIEKNAGIVKEVTKNVIKYSKDPWLIVVTNPLDAMVYIAKEVSKSKKVIGMASTLDSARLRYFIANELKTDVGNIDAMTIGCHGDGMVPLMSMAKVRGEPLSQYLPEEKINEIIQRTQKGGGEIVGLMGTSAYYAPAAAILEVIEAIDTGRIVPVSTEYKGSYVGLPVKLQNNKIEIQEDILKKMNGREKELFDKSIEHVKELIEKTKEILGE